MQNLKPIAVVHGIFVYSTMMIFEYSSQKYLNIRIRSTFVLRIYSYSYSVQNMILNIFVFVFVLKRTFRIYSYSYSGPKKIFATLCPDLVPLLPQHLELFHQYLLNSSRLVMFVCDITCILELFITEHC